MLVKVATVLFISVMQTSMIASAAIKFHYHRNRPVRFSGSWTLFCICIQLKFSLLICQQLQPLTIYYSPLQHLVELITEQCIFVLTPLALRPQYFYIVKSLPLLPIPRFLASPDHHQPWHWLCTIIRFMSSSMKYLKIHLSVQRGTNMQICFKLKILHAKSSGVWLLSWWDLQWDHHTADNNGWDNIDYSLISDVIHKIYTPGLKPGWHAPFTTFGAILHIRGTKKKSITLNMYMFTVVYLHKAWKRAIYVYSAQPYSNTVYMFALVVSILVINVVYLPI